LAAKTSLSEQFVNPSRQAAATPLAPPSELKPVDDGFEIGDVVSEEYTADRLWLLWQNRHVLFRFTLWALLMTTAVAFVIPKRYASTTRLMPPDNQSNSGIALLAAMASKGGVGPGALAGDLLGIKGSGALFTEIIRSRTVQDRLIARFDLRHVYHDRYWEDARKDLTEYSQISEDRKSGVISISVVDRDPQRATQMARAYVEELDRLVAEVSTSSARRERIFIEQRLGTVKRDLDVVSQQFSDYASRNSTIDITAQAKATVEAAAKLEGELIVAQSELQGLEQIYTDNNVRVRSLRARVDELRTQLHNVGGNPDPESGKDNDQDLPSIRQLPLLGVKWADLYRQVKVQETVYELLTQQYEMAKIQEAKEIPTVKILDDANLPEKKTSPHRLNIILVGGVLGLAIGILFVIGNAFWGELDPLDSRKRIADELHVSMRSLLHLLNPGIIGATESSKKMPSDDFDVHSSTSGPS
jgi:capsule polysaccharide export protein KpsE/RkpR